jgi:hypothetical protein
MSNTRNFHFRQPPRPQERLGNFKLGATPLANGSPVTAVAGTVGTDGRLVLSQAAAASAPVAGLTGVLNQELPWDGYSGYDTALTVAADLHLARALEQAQVCHGASTKVLVQNTEETVFEEGMDGVGTTYDAINMFLPADIATLAVGDMVTPGAGNTTDGYWKKTADATKSWGNVVYVDAEYSVVVFQLNF